LRTSINGVWWGGAVYLCLLLLSVAQLSVQAMTWFSQTMSEAYGIPITAYLMIAVALLIGLTAALFSGNRRLALALFLIIAAVAAVTLIGGAVLKCLHVNGLSPSAEAELATESIIVPVIALVATFMLMARPGLKAFFWAYLLSWAFFGLYRLGIHFGVLTGGDTQGTALTSHIPWGLNSRWTTVAALIIIGIYLIINAAFLQPYLGDAARYFRNSPANVRVRRQIRKEAVNTLDQLHRSRDYDRIVVVAHSLGTAVAYDMLRAYYSRICDQIPIQAYVADPDFIAVNGNMGDCRVLPVDPDVLRSSGRKLVGKLAAASQLLTTAARPDKYKAAKSDEVDAWLVTDFVTLGSPLTHACYFMAPGKDAQEMKRSFEASVREREYPTCPPAKLDCDGLIAYQDPNAKKLRLHHGGVFGLTRWTNLFFPMTNIFWGDAIGGPVQDPFGDCIVEVEVSSRRPARPGFFSHVDYWKTDCKPLARDAPHLRALIDAINLADR
jgi:hypothetical protein